MRRGLVREGWSLIVADPLAFLALAVELLTVRA